MKLDFKLLLIQCLLYAVRKNLCIVCPSLGTVKFPLFLVWLFTEQEVTRIFRMEELSMNPEQYTIVVTHINGDHVWLDHDITIDEALEDLTAPYHVEIAKFG